LSTERKLKTTTTQIDSSKYPLFIIKFHQEGIPQYMPVKGVMCFLEEDAPDTNYQNYDIKWDSVKVDDKKNSYIVRFYKDNEVFTRKYKPSYKVEHYKTVKVAPLPVVMVDSNVLKVKQYADMLKTGKLLKGIYRLLRIKQTGIWCCSNMKEKPTEATINLDFSTNADHTMVFKKASLVDLSSNTLYDIDLNGLLIFHTTSIPGMQYGR